MTGDDVIDDYADVLCDYSIGKQSLVLAIFDYAIGKEKEAGVITVDVRGCGSEKGLVSGPNATTWSIAMA